MADVAKAPTQPKPEKAEKPVAEKPADKGKKKEENT